MAMKRERKSRIGIETKSMLFNFHVRTELFFGDAINCGREWNKIGSENDDAVIILSQNDT